MLVTSILTSLIKIFILILPGVFCRRKGLVDVHQSDGINFVVTGMAWPCLVIDAMQISFSTSVFHEMLNIFALTAAIIVLMLLLSIPAAKLIRLDRTKQYLAMFMLVFGNTGFIGIPVIKALYGTDALFYAAILELINDALLFTVGIALIQMSAGAEIRMNPKQLLSPGLVGVFIGLVLFLTDTQLPEIIATPIEYVGNLTTPLAMFIIGFQLGGLTIKELTGDIKVYALAFVKLMIAPAIAFAAVKLLYGDFSLMQKTLILSFAMPVASCAALFSQQYHGELKLATKTVLTTTVLSIITIPIFAVLVEI